MIAENNPLFKSEAWQKQKNYSILFLQRRRENAESRSRRPAGSQRGKAMRKNPVWSRNLKLSRPAGCDIISPKQMLIKPCRDAGAENTGEKDPEVTA